MTTDRRWDWADGVGCLRGVGAEREALLGRLGLHTIGELLLHAPRRYEDRRHVQSMAALGVGETVLVQGRVVACGVKRWRRGAKSVFELILEEGGQRLHCRWWNQAFREHQFQRGQVLLVYGKVLGLRPPTMDHPEIERFEDGEEEGVHVGRWVPVYPLTEGLSGRWLRGLIWRVLKGNEVVIPEPMAGAAVLPPGMPKSRVEALGWLHFPERLEDAEEGRRRLALEELVELQKEVLRRRARLRERGGGRRCVGDNRLVRPFLARLGYELTSAQARVLREIRRDLAGGEPMRRLLQGDVGCGKTVVAACAALIAVEGGLEVVLMAPTEILAEQHFRVLRVWMEPLRVPVSLRTGSSTVRGGAPAAASSPGIVVGTHALITDRSLLGDPGLVIIDEQHRFGVAQREALVRRGRCPHLLVMTATPIPRTLGLTVYGDLDLSVIDALPRGRGRVRTFVRGRAQLPKVWAFVNEQLATGRQAYVVCPRIEGERGVDVRAARREHRELEMLCRPHAAGLLHGGMAMAEREQVLASFREGRLALLVTTTVVEVGVDVPNASVMVVLQADAFGLAQLHQLRGRIGRGAHESFCILVTEREDAAGLERLSVLAATQDGFQVAEEDLKRRGPGDFLGWAQSGAPAFRFVDLTRDLPLVELARSIAAVAC